MPIQKLSTSCSVNEANGLKNDIIQLHKSSEYLAADTNLSGIIAIMRGTGDVLTASIEYHGIASELGNEDHIRDDSYRNFFKCIVGYTSNPLPTLQKPALVVWEVLEPFGLGIISDSYVVESSKLSVIFKKLEDPAVEEAIKALPGAEILLADLIAKETAFEKFRVVYEVKLAQEKTIISASEAKKAVVKLINTQFIGYLTGMMGVQENKYGEFCRSVDQLISTINDAVKRRRGSRSKE